MLFGFSNYGASDKGSVGTPPQGTHNISNLEPVDTCKPENQPNLAQLFLYEHSRRLFSIDLLMEQGLSLSEAVRVSEPASLIQITQVPVYSYNFYQNCLT